MVSVSTVPAFCWLHEDGGWVDVVGMYDVELQEHCVVVGPVWVLSVAGVQRDVEVGVELSCWAVVERVALVGVVVFVWGDEGE